MSSILAREAYSPQVAAPAAYRSGLTGADSADWSVPLATPIKLGTNPTLAVLPRLTVSGATVVVRCGLYGYAGGVRTFVGLAPNGEVTATASAQHDGAGGYSAPPVLFDTLGFEEAEVRIGAPSGGATVILRAVGVGAGE